MMNERIRELDQQAIDYAMSVCDADGVYQGKEYLTVVKEKFAELLIRQCIQAVKNVGGYNEDYHMNAIKKYFGVEE